jgi:23S rRNA (cytidine1920-2'-O)/16S rRNA (cytidine1409-2'-O)-methyltransferase
MTSDKRRLDQLLVERGLVESRTLAQKWVMAGQVRVDGQVVYEPARALSLECEISLERGPRYVSRGGEKLAPALEAFGLDDLAGRVCADVGASTGGFSDCLLQHGAQRVYAIDVGYGVLHWKLRSDPRVVVMERTNARHVSALPELVELVTIDASFISLRVLLPVVKGWLEPQRGEVVALIKPQFEAQRAEVDRGEGVIHDPQVHQAVLRQTLEACAGMGFTVAGLIRSSLKGPKGNVEFLVHLRQGTAPAGNFDPLIRQALS